MIEAPVTKCDSGTQTDTHFMESNIVKSYEWNEWELRRKALKLVSHYNCQLSCSEFDIIDICTCSPRREYLGCENLLSEFKYEYEHMKIVCSEKYLAKCSYLIVIN